MRSYKLVHQLLNLVEDYEKENPDKKATVQDFAGFLVNNLLQPGHNLAGSDVRFGVYEPKAQELAFRVENSIARLVIYMSRYGKSYIKKALEGTPLQTPEDFTCLAILLTHDRLSKTELINRNIQEKTSGTEVIKRLINAGLAIQRDNETDKRSKNISITETGKVLLYKLFEHMNHVGTIVTGNLTLTEKLTLHHLLQKLEDFHYPVHENKTIGNKEDLHMLAASLSY